jgi:hypothetical protein
LPPDGGLAGARKADEDQPHSRQFGLLHEPVP